MTDDSMVHHPAHYAGKTECIDCIESMCEGTTDGVAAYLKGAALKYLWRAGRKDDAVQDLAKAQWYIARLMARLQEKSE